MFFQLTNTNIVILVIHFLATLSLLSSTFELGRKIGFKINIHTLPALLIGFLLMLGGISLALVNLWFYIPTGIILGLICWYVNSMPALPPISTYSKARISFTAVLFWPEICASVAFLFFNINKFYEKPKH